MNTFTFSGKLKRYLLLLILAGAAFIAIGALTFGGGGDHGDDHGAPEKAHAALALNEQAPGVDEAYTDASGHGLLAAGGGGDHGDDHGHGAPAPTLKQVIVANSWAMIQYLLWAGIAAMFFIAAHTVGWAGWHIQVQKISLAIMTLIPVMAVLGIIVYAIGYYELFEWTHLYLFDPADERFDALLAGKQMFLNKGAFAGFGLLWIGILLALLAGWWRNMSRMDSTADIKYFRSSRSLGAVSIVFIAIINAFGVWHWIMSIEPHWYSTLFTWYTMASAAAGMFAFTILVAMILQNMGYLPNVNENHYHDLGKYLFAISVFWTYLWFSQFMLIWYGNIPEETIYFIKRMENYPVLFYGSFIINFLLPFFVLLKRDTKRNAGVLMFMCVMLILGHWFDFFNSIVTPVVTSGGMGLIAIGCLLLFTGVAGYVVFFALTRMQDLESSQHPYFKESLNHHI